MTDLPRSCPLLACLLFTAIASGCRSTSEPLKNLQGSTAATRPSGKAPKAAPARKQAKPLSAESNAALDSSESVPTPTSPDLPPAWEAAGFAAEDARDWAAQGFEAPTARAWHVRGLTPAWARHCSEAASIAPGALQAAQVSQMRCAFPIGLVLPGLAWEMNREQVRSILHCREPSAAIRLGQQALSCESVHTALLPSPVPLAQFWFTAGYLEAVRLSLKDDDGGDDSKGFDEAARSLAAIAGEAKRASAAPQSVWNTTTLQFGEGARMRNQISKEGKVIGSNIDLLNQRDRRALLR